MSVNINEEEQLITGDELYQQSPESLHQASEKPVTWRNKFLFIIERRPGISNLQVSIYFCVVTCMVIGLSYIGVTNQFLLQTYLKTPHGTEGEVIGDLTFYTEVAMLFSSWIWGAFSDTVGSRKPVFVLSFSIIAFGIALQPLCTTFTTLLIVRLVYGIGVSGVLGIYLATVADYTVDKDRGKASGIIGLCQNIGALITSFLLVKIPLWIAKGDKLTEGQAGYIGFSIVGMIQIIAAIASAIFLYDGISAVKEDSGDSSDVTIEKKPTSKYMHYMKKFLKTFTEGITAMRDPIVVLAYIAAFVSRMDVSLITFTSLWISQAYGDIGYTQSEALSQAGVIIGVAVIFGLIITPPLGFLGDRMNRTLLLCLTCLIAAFAFGIVILLPDVVGWWVYPWTAAMCASNVSVMLCSNILITQAAPKESRGSVIGVYMLMAAIGVMVSCKTGGILFDINHAYPYLMVAGCNALLTVLCAVVLLFQGAKWLWTGALRAENIPETI
jgi:MFS family permease